MRGLARPGLVMKQVKTNFPRAFWSRATQTVEHGEMEPIYWIPFHASLQIATLVQDLRKELDRLLESKIENPSLDLMSCARGSRIIDTIVRLISTQ